MYLEEEEETVGMKKTQPNLLANSRTALYYFTFYEYWKMLRSEILFILIDAVSLR